MQSCSIQHCILLFLTFTFTTVPTLAYTSVSVKLHQSATLPCNYRCSGLVKWTLFQNSGYILAQCNQTSCWSEKGYDMSHDQYLEGKAHLTITAADYSNRGFYTCQCNGVEACDVRLIIDTLISSVELNPGEALVMDLPIPEPTEVIYKPRDSAGLYGEQICTVTGHSLQCKDEYKVRTSLSHTNITVTGVNMSDSGSYTIRDRKNEENIHIYTLTVKVVKPGSERKQEVLYWVVGVMVLLLIIIVAVFGVKCHRHIKHLEKEKADLEETLQLNNTTEVDQSRRRANSFGDVLQLMRQMLEVEKLIQQYRTESVGKSQSWTTLNDIPVVELLKRKRAEMEEEVQSRGMLEKDTIHQWWDLKRPQLDMIIEHWTMRDTELSQERQAERCSRS